MGTKTIRVSKFTLAKIEYWKGILELNSITETADLMIALGEIYLRRTQMKRGRGRPKKPPLFLDGGVVSHYVYYRQSKANPEIYYEILSLMKLTNEEIDRIAEYSDQYKEILENFWHLAVKEIRMKHHPHDMTYTTLYP